MQLLPKLKSGVSSNKLRPQVRRIEIHLRRYVSSSFIGPPPKFLSEIFYLTLAMNHYGLQKTISSLDELARDHSDLTRHVEQLQGDGSWQAVSTIY